MGQGIITVPSLLRHLPITAPTPYHHCTITAPSLHHHCKAKTAAGGFTVPTTIQQEHDAITVPSLHHHCTITAHLTAETSISKLMSLNYDLANCEPSLHHHCTITAPSPSPQERDFSPFLRAAEKQPDVCGHCNTFDSVAAFRSPPTNPQLFV